MKVIHQRLFSNKGNMLFAVMIGISTALLHHLVWLQRNFFSWRFLAYSLLITLGMSLLSAWLNQRVLAQPFQALSKPLRAFMVMMAVLLGLALLVQTRFQPAYFMLPDAQLEMRFTIDDLTPDAEGVRLLGLRTQWDYEPFTRMEIDGAWRKDGDNLLFSGSQSVRIRWQGRVGPWAEITFRHTSFDQFVRVDWQGVQTTANLALPEEETIVIRQDFNLPWFYYLPYVLSFMITVGYALAAALLILGTWRRPSDVQRQPKKNAWLLFMLPMLAAWVFTLLVFWPGFLTKDSIDQWRQSYYGEFNNWHPAFHSLIIAMLMRIWYSPAIVALLQIILLALVVAWGLGTLQKYGVPVLVLWVISFLFAVSPINNLQLITLWKDIPYAIAVLWMTILLIRMVLSRGAANQRTCDWIILGLAGFCVSIFRKNGFLEAAAALFILLIVYRPYRKQFIGSLLVSVIVYALVNGPLYTLIGVEKVSTGQSNLVLLHHISAHVASGTQFEKDERAYLESIMPFEQWDYSCCSVRTVSYDDDLDRSTFLMNIRENLHIAARLLVRNPQVDIQHMLCASELVWRFGNNQCDIRNTQVFTPAEILQTNFIYPNTFELETDPVLDELADDYIGLMGYLGLVKENLVTSLRPAVWLYLTIFCTAILTLRRHDLRMSLAGTLIIIQAILLFFISFAPNFRYHFSTHLVGLFSLGWLFVENRTEKD